MDLIQVLNKTLYQLNTEYEKLKADPQFKESLRDLKKYNSKYL